MAKKRGTKPGVGQRVRVNDGVTMPEFPHLVIGGWTGMVLETQGRGADSKVILQWDESVSAALPDDYRKHCESQGLFYEMACLPASAVSADENPN
jgi:hypothetical protein